MKDVYVVIGGSGLLGRHIAEQLHNRGDTVAVVDLVQRFNDIPFHHSDISDPEAILTVLKKLRPTCVIHTAAPHANADDILLKRVIEDGTNNVISACHATGVQKLVYTSSSGVIFSGYDINCGDESFPYTTTPMGMYMVAKISAEKAVLAANGQHGLLTTVLRPSGIFGPGDRQMITVTFRLFQEGKTHIQLGNNQNMADWTYVINVADAHVLAADKLSASPHSSVAGEIFIITNDEPWPFWDFHNGVWDRLDKYYPGHRVKRKPIIIPALFAMILGAISEFVAWLTGRPTNFTRWNCIFSCRARWHSIEKAKKMLGYRPKVNMNDGIDYLVEWWMKEVEKEKAANLST